jgi:hypothetical protein
MTTSKIKQHNQDDKKVYKATNVKIYTPLDLESRTVIPTDVAAFHLNRKSQTLRSWACFENGPIRPIRISGRLAWQLADVITLIKKGAL